MIRKLPLACLIGAAACGCTLGPDYRRPDVAMPQVWRQSAETRESSDRAWWEQFADPALARLVGRALEGNEDLAIAAANVEQAFARYGIARSALFPQLDAGATAGRVRTTDNGPSPQRGAGTGFEDYAAGLSASFEIDIWGRLRRASESARANLLASEEARNTVVLTLVASVANGYIQLRALDRQLEIAASTMLALGDAARLQRVRFAEGAVPESDWRQAEAQFRAAAAQVPELQRLIARQENFLNVLLGRNPGPIERGRTIDALAFPTPPGGLPAQLLERRPDIRQAEQQLVAANADIGVAKAAHFPRISLTGLLGLRSGELSDLVSNGSRHWSFGANFAAPIFDAGRIRNQVAGTEAAERAALAAYRKAIVTAFQEVENALSDRARFAEALEAHAANVAALQRFRDLAALRYREGAAIYLEVARAEESLFNAQLAHVAVQSQLFQAYANLYRSMGGGWATLAGASMAEGPNLHTGGMK